MRARLIRLSILLVLARFCDPGVAQVHWPADHALPGDEMIQSYLRQTALDIHAGFADDVRPENDRAGRGEMHRRQFRYMLGLEPLPPRTPLQAVVTGSIQGDGFVVEKLHFQSAPRLYVTANLYRPPNVAPGERLPAVLYVCGHAGRTRDGVKVSYQSNCIWFARHGYICLILDTLERGEIKSVHHGTYRQQRWWWLSRGYTPAGVECWNGMRAIDYLVSRPDVDPERLAVTGISGGGAVSFWIAAADERIKAAAPISGMADLPAYVGDHYVNGHCDCMFMWNAFSWPWTRIAALIAPRPLLFVNSDQDRLFPMDANQRIINRLENVYRLYGAGDQVDALVSVGGHAYRQDIRRAVYRFINTHLKNDPRPVGDSEIDLVIEGEDGPVFPIPPGRLRVFADDEDLPADELNTTVDEHFIPAADVALPEPGQFDTWKRGLLAELRRVTLRPFPQRIPPAVRLGHSSTGQWRMASEPGIEFRLYPGSARSPEPLSRVVLVVNGDESGDVPGDVGFRSGGAEDLLFFCDPRGVGETRWTRKNPPNYVERAFALLGRTVDAGRVWDVAAAARYLRNANPRLPLAVVGAGGAGVVAAFAALCEPAIDQVIVSDPPSSFMEPAAPVLLNVLRVCDVPEVLGMLAPRPLTLKNAPEALAARIAAIYAAAGSAAALNGE